MGEKNKEKPKGTMLFSLGDKRIERFKKIADEKEMNYSSVIQFLIDEWIQKNEPQKTSQD